MSTKTITPTITKAITLILVMIIAVACDNDRGMMHDSVSMGNDPWNWGQILISLAFGLVAGFFLGLFASRMKK